MVFWVEVGQNSCKETFRRAEQCCFSVQKWLFVLRPLPCGPQFLRCIWWPQRAICGPRSGRSVAWLARLFRVQEVVSSNLTAPTTLLYWIYFSNW